MATEAARLVCAGEALTDLIRHDADTWHSRVGGSTWNVARALASLGAAAGFAGAISQDVFGDALWEASRAAGLDLRYLQRYPRAPLLAVVPSTTPPDYFFIGADSADLHFDPQALPGGWMAEARWLHVGGISLARAPLAARLVALAGEARAAGLRISYDPNYRKLMDAGYDTTLRQVAALADVIKVSDDDLRALFRTGDALAALARLRAINPHAAVLYTRGAAGASLFAGANAWHAGAPPIALVDSVGAGDASTAGLLYSLDRYPQRGWQRHLDFAVACGTAACCAPGAHAPSLAEVEALLEAP
ncbi:MAG: carbohydrate kinase family protein [Massilia sp.]